MSESLPLENELINNLFLQNLKNNQLVSSMTIRLVKGI